MFLGLDHLVIAVMDPDAAATELERAVGLRCTGGGRHPSWGTWNRLAWLGDTYVELIGVFDRSLAPNGAVSRVVSDAIDRGHVGLVSYAIASDRLGPELDRLRAAGSRLSDIELRSRTRPDGEIVAWRASFPPALGPAEPPFVIEHELSGAEWGAEARIERAAYRHPLGGIARVTALELPVPEPSAVASRYAETLGLAFHDGSVGPTTVIGSQEVRLLAGRPLIDLAVIEIAVGGLAGVADDPTGSPSDPASPASPASPPAEVDALGARWRVRR